MSVQKRCRRCALPPQSKISFARHGDGEDAKDLTSRANQRMNQPTKLRSCFTLATLLVAAVLFSGCGAMLYPHTTERSQEVRGRVLDAQTRLPIKGAKISLYQSPHHPTHTDGNGYFRLKATRNFHTGVNLAGGEDPDGGSAPSLGRIRSLPARGGTDESEQGSAPCTRWSAKHAHRQSR